MLAALVAFLLLWLPPLRPGEPFSSLGFDAALAKAKDEKKLLLVDFTATWCGPCRKMEKDTWASGDVRAWLAENAIAIQVDVDVERDLAKRFRIGSMPTVVVMLGAEEFDRAIGYKDAAQFLAWARDVRAGRRSSDELTERSKALRESTDVRARYDLARDPHTPAKMTKRFTTTFGRPATRAELGFGGVRTSFLLGDMASLAKRHEPSRKAFDEIFTGLQASVDVEGLPSFDAWQEWTAFCRYFNGNARVVAWYEKRRDERGRMFADRAEPIYPDEDLLIRLKKDSLADHREGFLVGLIVAEVFDVLMEEERFLDAVRLYDDARAPARRFLTHYEAMQPLEGIEEEDEEFERYLQAELIQDMARLYGALLMAERYEEADAVAASLLEKLDTPEARLQLVYQGLSMTEKPHPSFELWLNEAEASGSDVEQLRWKLSKLDHPKGD